MRISSILIANRGEIAVRVMRAAADLGLRTVGVYSEDDQDSLHTRISEDNFALLGVGPKAYLSIDGIIEAAVTFQCDAIHPGYGFLSESAEFASRCIEAGIIFIGPNSDVLKLFGDKTLARIAAVDANVPVPRGLNKPVDVGEIQEFYRDLGPGAAIIIKAIKGGGGRGTRVVKKFENIESEYKRCASEAFAAFGCSDLFVEEFFPTARHIEIQILGDEHGSIVDLGERDCSVQRRHQKLIEIAPSPFLKAPLRADIVECAIRIAMSVGYVNLGTFEFLVVESETDRHQSFFFIETNPRLQVEHTVTELVTGVDIVQSQILLAGGFTLDDLGLNKPNDLKPRGFAIQARVNMETYDLDGTLRPAVGVLTAYEEPGGPGVRTDGFGYVGYKTSIHYDSLLAKVICHTNGPNFHDTIVRCQRALSEFRIDGVRVNISFLQNIFHHEDFAKGDVHTRWIDEKLKELASINENYPKRFFSKGHVANVPRNIEGYAGSKIDSRDPLALFDYDSRVRSENNAEQLFSEADKGLSDGKLVGIYAPIQGTILSFEVSLNDEVIEGQEVAVIEAMKMEHVIVAPATGVIREVKMISGDVVREGYPIAFIESKKIVKNNTIKRDHSEFDPGHVRPDLREVIERHAFTLDESRTDVVAKYAKRGYRMPRENIEQLVDPGSFQEYWPLIVAQQHQRFDMNDLRIKTPGDGVVAGTASINGRIFEDEFSRAIVVAYDYTVLAGTQGRRNHYKQDRMFDLANRFKLPIVLFSEGGGGRPGDDDDGPRVDFDTYTFTQFSKLSGLVPLIGVNNGRCFAGNTALLGCCDVIIATRASTIAMGGPAMIEGGGLGIYTPEEVGPMSFQVPNGVVDILVDDSRTAVEVAKKYLSYFQGNLDEWEASDQLRLRHIVPENRVRLYDMRDVIYTLSDIDSVLEIRKEFGVGIITAFIRIEGRALGVIANNPHHLAGAIDSDGADKGARFMQLCDAFDIPILSLMDCPGIMVGPEVEKTALVRHCTRMFNTGANLTTPLFGVVVRKAYGLGVQAMCGASSLVGFFTIAWPTAEFAGMNIEGAVKLGHRKELAVISDPEKRREEFETRVNRAYEKARAVNAGSGGGLDDVIDPAETRTWIANSLRRLPPRSARSVKKYTYIDTW